MWVNLGMVLKFSFATLYIKSLLPSKYENLNNPSVIHKLKNVYDAKFAVEIPSQ